MSCRALKNVLSELGEAVKAPPVNALHRHPKVDWKGFAGLRDLVAHPYFSLDTRRLLPILNNEVPALLAAAEKELSPPESREAPERRPAPCP